MPPIWHPPSPLGVRVDLVIENGINRNVVPTFLFDFYTHYIGLSCTVWPQYTTRRIWYNRSDIVWAAATTDWRTGWADERINTNSVSWRHPATSTYSSVRYLHYFYPYYIGISITTRFDNTKSLCGGVGWRHSKETNDVTNKTASLF